MHVRVLGCHGGESPSHRPSCFAIDDKLLLDAGASTRSLSLAEQARVDFVFISHSHLDHVKGLPLLLDNIVGLRDKPLELIASPGTADILDRHLFNGLLWPDFSKIPSPDKPTIHTMRVTPGERCVLGGFELTLVPVHHTVECHGVIVTTKSGSLAYSGDTGPTFDFWNTVNALPKLRAVICEVSFPDELQELARVSGHLTPKLLAAELEKFAPQVDAPVYITHIKPAAEAKVKEQLLALGNPRVKLLRPMDEFDL